MHHQRLDDAAELQRQQQMAAPRSAAAAAGPPYGGFPSEPQPYQQQQQQQQEAGSRFYREPLDALLRESNVSPTSGLSSAQAAQLLQRYGYNELEQEERIPMWKLWLSQFKSLIVQVQCLASLVSYALGETIEGTAVAIIVTITVSLSTYMEQSAGNALEALSKLSRATATVVRDGRQASVPSREIVPGDIVALQSGDVVPADIRLITAVGLKVNEMILTGESEDVSKHATISGIELEGKLSAPNMCFSSTNVTDGIATALVVATGMNTRVGAIARLLKESSASADDSSKKQQAKKEGDPDEDDPSAPKKKEEPGKPVSAHSKKTPLQVKLDKLQLNIATIAVVTCTFVFIIGLLTGYDDPDKAGTAPWLQLMLIAVSLAVSFIPEGMPLVVTICLALGTADMIKHHALIRKLPAVETLGSAQVICTDKTGTLTEGKMTAVRMWADGSEYEITGKGFAPEGDFLLRGQNVLQAAAGPSIASASGKDVSRTARLHAALIRTVLSAALLCSNTEMIQEVQFSKGDEQRRRELEERAAREGTRADLSSLGTRVWKPKGNSSEAPLVVAAAKAGIQRASMFQQFPRVLQVPFSSKRKMMLTLHRLDVANEAVTDGVFHVQRQPCLSSARYVVCVKGAPNFLLNNCVTELSLNGKTSSLVPTRRDEINSSVDDLSSQALRVLAVAIKPLASLPEGMTEENAATLDADQVFQQLSQGLIFTGLVASIDPERDGVRDSVNISRHAGVRVIMITGDYLKTAVAIAKNINLLTVSSDPDSEATDCEKLRPYGSEYLPDADLDEITSRVVVFARAKPEDKIEIVKSLQRQGFVTAMTGDGVNDAPALNRADIGIAMGLNGTEVAKGASDMVLTDDNFNSIVTAVRKGRIIYSNIQKFVTYFLGTNVSQAALIFASVAIGIPSPLGPLSILFFNLAVDGMPALSISTEPGDRHIMDDPPRPRRQPIVVGRMWPAAMIHAAVLATSLFISMTVGLYLHTGVVFMSDLNNVARSNGTIPCHHLTGDRGWIKDFSPRCVAIGVESARTMVFVNMLFSEGLRGFTVRSKMPFYYKPLANKWLVRASAGALSMGIIILFAPFMQHIFGLTNVESYSWMISIFLVLCGITIDELLKYSFRRADAAEKHWIDNKQMLDQIMIEARALRHNISLLRDEVTHTKRRAPRRLSESVDGASRSSLAAPQGSTLLADMAAASAAAAAASAAAPTSAAAVVGVAHESKTDGGLL